MKTTWILLLVVLPPLARAESVSLYRVEAPGVPIYSPAADFIKIYDHDMNGKEELISGEFTRRNRQLIAAFDAILFAPLGADISKTQLAELHKSLIHDPVAGRHPQKNYDSRGGQIGFCYGRALLVQKQLERLGADPRRIFKVFLLGELSQQGVLWDYHVATLYVNHQGEKLLIDSLHEEVLPLTNWYQSMHRYFLNPVRPKVLLYFAEAGKFQARSGGFTPAAVFDPIYNGFFLDLALWL